MGLNRLLFVGAVTVLTVAGCGGSSDKTSTSATQAPATTASTATTGIAGRLLTGNELRGFTRTPPSVANTVSAWLAATQTPSQQVASETRRLTRLGFVAGAHGDLTGAGKDGASVVEQFKRPGGARSELANVVKMFKANAAARSEAAIIAAAKRLYRRVHG